jgi:hypothetical protein
LLTLPSREPFIELEEGWNLMKAEKLRKTERSIIKSREV